MSTSNHLQIVCVVELLSNVLAKCVTSTSRIHTPTCTFIWVRPKEVAHRTLVRNFLESLKCSNVIKSLNTGRKPTMQTEELILNHSSEREVIEELSENLPNIGVSILPATFIIESINLSDLPGLMISSQNSYSVFVSHF